MANPKNVTSDTPPSGGGTADSTQIGERRGARRVRAAQYARLVLDSAEVHCLIRDISAGGARVTLAANINAETADRLVMVEERSEIPVAFVWQRDLEVGLAFN